METGGAMKKMKKKPERQFPSQPGGDQTDSIVN